jgi:hypothetical protein
LSAQPDNIRQIIKDTIEKETSNAKDITQVGTRMIKFCASYDLNKISENIQSYAEPFNARYVV